MLDVGFWFVHSSVDVLDPMLVWNEKEIVYVGKLVGQRVVPSMAGFLIKIWLP